MTESCYYAVQDVARWTARRFRCRHCLDAMESALLQHTILKPPADTADLFKTGVALCRHVAEKEARRRALLRAVPSRHYNPIAELERRLDYETIMGIAQETLPTFEWTIFSMRHTSCPVTWAEVAAATGRSRSWCQNAYRRGLQQLRKRLKRPHLHIHRQAC